MYFDYRFSRSQTLSKPKLWFAHIFFGKKGEHSHCFRFLKMLNILCRAVMPLPFGSWSISKGLWSGPEACCPLNFVQPIQSSLQWSVGQLEIDSFQFHSWVYHHKEALQNICLNDFFLLSKKRLIALINIYTRSPSTVHLINFLHFFV